MKFIYGLLIISILITLPSCRKDKAFVIKKTELVSKEEIDSLKNIERKLLIWRNKKNYTTLRKYLDAKEAYLKFSKKEILDRLFLSEYYFYLSFMAKSSSEKIYALEKGINNSKWILRKTSQEYDNKSIKFEQDYQIINSIDEGQVATLYWYITNNVFLRNEKENLILYKDDLEASFKYYYKISTNKERIFAEAVYLRNLPKIGGRDKETAKKILDSLKEEDKTYILIKLLYLKDYPKENIKKLRISSNSDDFEAQIFNEISKNIIDIKK